MVGHTFSLFKINFPLTHSAKFKIKEEKTDAYVDALKTANT